MTSTRQKTICFLFVTALFLLSTPVLLKADFRIGIYLFEKAGGGIDFSENKEVWSSDPNCDMIWGQIDRFYMDGLIIDLGKKENFFAVLEAPDSSYIYREVNMAINHIYVLKTNENCYVKFIIISEFLHAMLWVYQDDSSRNLDWRDTTTGVSRKTINTLLNPMEPILMQNYPNPFNSVTTVTLSVPTNGFHQVKLSVLNSRGRSVAELLDEKLSGGTFQIKWDGKAKSGVVVPSGIYFINAMIDHKYSLSRRALLIK